MVLSLKRDLWTKVPLKTADRFLLRIFVMSWFRASPKPSSLFREMIERWFLNYGFAKELVLEACNRTMEATHTPSFRYADKILTEWKKAGVKSLRDVALLDQKRQERQSASRAGKRPANQFHNFEQRDTDYDSMVMDQVKSWITEP